MSNYSLEIISHHPKFSNKSLRKYYVDGIETVGAWGDEPFEIRFKNNTWQKVQVKISLDGTDIFTGELADTQVSKDMWVVNGGATLSLKAWPENNNGGASFVFTGANNSVAVHTHGDLSNRGIIAAAVFTEGHIEPIKVSPPVERHYHHYTYPYYLYIPTHPDFTYGYEYIPTWGTNSNSIGDIGANSVYSCSVNNSFNNIGEASNEVRGLEDLVAVGAGQYVDQKITYVAGLIKPQFSETVRMKYLWWDDLVNKLRAETVVQPQPSGFPGDHNRKNIDLKGTPRIGEKKGVVRRTEPQYQVFDRF